MWSLCACGSATCARHDEGGPAAYRSSFPNVCCTASTEVSGYNRGVSSPLPNEAPDAELDAIVRTSRTRFVAKQSVLPAAFSPLGALLLTAALWHTGQAQRLSFWASGVIAVGCFRVLLMLAYPRFAADTPALRTWERAFVASALVVAAWWGVGGLFLLGGSRADQYLVYSFLMLMAGGASASYAAHSTTVLPAVILLLLPITLRFAWQDDAPSRVMAVASGMYMIAAVRATRMLGRFFAGHEQLSHELARARDRAERLARVDHLTGLCNRRAFYELGESTLRHAQRYGHPAALILLDVDDFKTINDAFGHAAGDDVLRAVATLIREHRRATDIAGRLGGDEIAVLLPETSEADALCTAERLRRIAQEHAVSREGRQIHFTVSLGVAPWMEGQPLESLIARADAALYDAKRAGRNGARSQSGFHGTESLPAAAPRSGTE